MSTRSSPDGLHAKRSNAHMLRMKKLDTGRWYGECRTCEFTTVEDDYRNLRRAADWHIKESGGY
jgi:hypothetical protein